MFILLVKIIVMKKPFSIEKKIKYFMGMVLLLLLSTVFSCKKNSGSSPPANNNQINATVVFSSGNTIIINATGTKATMGCSFLDGTFVNGTNDASHGNGAVLFSTLGTNCITGVGTYNIECQYRENTADPNTNIYTESGASSVTFTVFTANEMEGTFNSICLCNGCVGGSVDPVVVSGSFKGNILH
jgi:hypothetical protein